MMPCYGLIGNPVSHSRSPRLFGEWCEKQGVSLPYGLYPLETIGELHLLLGAHPDLAGLNVTYPFKEAVTPFMDHLDDSAAQCQAVNTILVQDKDGQHVLTGFNTDGKGFLRAYSQNFQDDDRFLILGTGGAARAVRHTLEGNGYECSLVSRNARNPVLAYEDINAEVLEQYRVIVQATPLGMGQLSSSAPPFPVHLLKPQHLVIDLVYSPGETVFLRSAASFGAETRNGLGMLREQAFLSYGIWDDARKTR